MPDYEEKIKDLTNAKPTSGGFVGSCPIHDDKSPSLSIKFREGKSPLIHCHAGCEFDDIRDYFIEHNSWPAYKKESASNNFIIGVQDAFKPTYKGCIAAKYLRNRGLALPDGMVFDSLRYHESHYHSDYKANYPALIGGIYKDGERIGIQRIYIDSKFNKLGNPKIAGSFSGGHIPLGDKRSEVLHLAEGIETALAIFLQLREPTWVAVNAGNLSKVSPPKTIRTLHIWADKDKSGTGEKEALKAAEKFAQCGIKVIIHLPEQDIPEGKKSWDFLDVYNLEPGLINKESLKGKVIHHTITSISTPSYDLPKMDDSYLPFTFRKWCFDHAKRLNVPPEMIFAPLICIMGSLIGRKLVIRPKKKDHWEEYGNIWCLIIAPPGTKKSPAISISTRLLGKLEEKEAEKAKAQRDQNAPKIISLKAKIKQLKNLIHQCSKEENEIDHERLAHELAKKDKELTRLEVIPKRFSTNGFTVEKLIDLIVENPNGLLLFRDEISAFFESFKKQGHETDRQFFLEGWNGNGSFNYDTISRGTKSVKGICLSLLGGIQPSLIKDILNEMRNGRSNDGFIQRFQLIIYPNGDLTAKYVDEGVCPKEDQKILDFLEQIANLESEKHGKLDERSTIHFSSLDEEAYLAFSGYMDSHEKEISEAEDSPYKNHLSKFNKLLPSLILIFHVIDNLETKRTNIKVQKHIVDMSIMWTELFKAHAKKLYDTEYCFEAICGFALAQKIVDKKVQDGIGLRAIYKNCWTNLKTQSEVEFAANFLQKHNWLQVVEVKPTSGRPSSILKFNSGLENFLETKVWHQ